MSAPSDLPQAAESLAKKKKSTRGGTDDDEGSEEMMMCWLLPHPREAKQAGEGRSVVF